MFVFLFSCQTEKSQEMVHNELVAEDVLWLTDAQIQRAGITFQQAQKINMGSVIYANGYIGLPPGKSAVLTPMINGYISEIRKLPGQSVKKGEIVAVINSMEYLELQQNFQESAGKLIYLKQEFSRQEYLKTVDASTAKQQLLAESEYKTTRATYSGLAEKLLLLGADTSQIAAGMVSPKLYLKAPIAGFVTKANAAIGMHFGTNEELFEIIDTRFAYLILNVFEKDAMLIKPSQKVLFSIPNMYQETFEGTISVTGNNIDPETRSMQALVQIDNSQSRFKIGMYVSAEIITESREVLALPDQALSVSPEGSHVFVLSDQSADGHGVKMEDVVSGIKRNGMTEITSPDTTKLYVVSGLKTLVNAFHEGSHDH